MLLLVVLYLQASLRIGRFIFKEMIKFLTAFIHLLFKASKIHLITSASPTATPQLIPQPAPRDVTPPRGRAASPSRLSPGVIRKLGCIVSGRDMSRCHPNRVARRFVKLIFWNHTISDQYNKCESLSIFISFTLKRLDEIG